MARRLERLTDLASSLEEDAQCHVVELDVRDSNAVSEAFATLPELFHQPDILINNAGLALGLSGADAVDLDDWETMVDTNIKGLMYCTRACLPMMVEQGRGHVINMGSVAANWPYPGGNVYGGTKAFVQQFTRNLRTDLLGKGVRATVIEPGMCETEFSVVRFSGDESKAAAVYEGMKPLSADDIADVIVWVALRPAHVNINQIELMPVEQTWSPFAVHREL